MFDFTSSVTIAAMASGAYVCVSFALAAGCLALFRKLAPHMQLLDKPGGRKTHDGAVPLIGGLAIAVAVAVSSVAVGFDWGRFWYLALGAWTLLAVGMWDDRSAVSSTLKFVVQALVAVLVVFEEADAIRRVGYTLFGPGAQWNLLSYAIAFFFIVGFINAFNMIDGIDGLAGSLVLTMSVALLLVAGGSYSVVGVNLLLLVIIGAVCAFLVFNLWLPSRHRRQRYRVFLGDAGTMVLGLLIAWCALHIAGAPSSNPEGAGVVSWIVAYPVSDTVAVMTLRLLQGSHPFTPDRQHLHHLLLARGLSVYATLGVINLLSWIGIGYAFAGDALGLGDGVLVLSVLVLMTVHVGIVYWFARHARAQLPSHL